MLTKEEIQAIVQAYGETAARTREAGYDAVELHMAHAYTLASFMSARNKRTDEYGGRSLEPRMRLMSEVILEVRRQVGADYAVGVRFDGEECIKDGYGLSDSKYLALRRTRATRATAPCPRRPTLSARTSTWPIASRASFARMAARPR
jgi:2,4-dienoyl-CoA reductase-like NADH-dependent reductase (Old Yellow Enzyme family)